MKWLSEPRAADPLHHDVEVCVIYHDGVDVYWGPIGLTAMSFTSLEKGDLVYAFGAHLDTFLGDVGG